VEYDPSYDTNGPAESALEKYLSQDKNGGGGRVESDFMDFESGIRNGHALLLIA
jgi:hypothetical protein